MASSGLFFLIKNKANRYIFFLFVFFCGLMFSKAILSLSVAALAANWLFDPEIVRKVRSIPKNKPLLAVLSIYIIHVAGLIYTTDFQYALSDLRIKLPLLVLPVVFATEQNILRPFFKQISYSFLTFVTISAFISFFLYLGNDLISVRSVSPFMSHIRFGLLTTIASFFLFYLFLSSENKKSALSLLYIAGALFHAFFTVFILGSVNGIFIFGTLFLFWAIVYIFKSSSKTLSVLLISGLVLVVAVFGLYVVRIHNTYFPQQKKMPGELPEFTQQGNPYLHEHENPVYENGIPLYGFYCLIELREQWNKRSNIKIGESQDSIYSIHDVLIRYLTSKGLPKDSLGISNLSDTDIKNIEKGITNYRLVGKSPLEYRLYELFYGYYSYKYFKKEYNNSLFLRVEYTKTALEIIKMNPIFGVGTGDVNIAFAKQYEQSNSILKPEWRRRAHNQYLSITVAFGVIGLAIFIFALIYPAIRLRKFGSFYFLTVWLVLILSMLSEDTIETQIGASIFSFFYSFFLFVEPINDLQNNHKINQEP
jgi:hypothetical protein